MKRDWYIETLGLDLPPMNCNIGNARVGAVMGGEYWIAFNGDGSITVYDRDLSNIESQISASF
jgi:hypothetical protein